MCDVIRSQLRMNQYELIVNITTPIKFNLNTLKLYRTYISFLFFLNWSNIYFIFVFTWCRIIYDQNWMGAANIRLVFIVTFVFLVYFYCLIKSVFLLFYVLINSNGREWGCIIWTWNENKDMITLIDFPFDIDNTIGQTNYSSVLQYLLVIVVCPTFSPHEVWCSELTIRGWFADW